MLRPGPSNLITDVDGIHVGHADDPAVRTGTTVVVPEPAAVAAVDVRGGAPGTRETEVLRPTSLVRHVDAVVLSGGSVWGLDAAAGVVAWLRHRGRGFPIGEFRVPIVPAAILFDLGNGGDKDWDEPPYRALGRIAAERAGPGGFPLGNVGAGFGAAAGCLKGGLGSASAIADDGLQVGALVAVNPVGSVVMPGSGVLWGAVLRQREELGPGLPYGGGGDLDLDLPAEGRIGGHTCVGVVATNAALDKAEAQRVAIMAHDGLARAVRPVHTPFDGDTIFALATARLPLAEPAPLALARIGHIAADCVTRAVARAVVAAEGLGQLPGYRAWLAGKAGD